MLESWHVIRLSMMIAIALAVVGAVGSVSAEVARHPCVPKSAEIRFKAADGTRLAGYRLGQGKTAVLLAHQSRGDACQWGSYSKRLAKLGYTVISIDFRGYGDSQYRLGRAAGRLPADVAAAAKVARARGARKVFAVGASMGGTVVLAAGTSIRPQLNGVVSLSGPAVFSYVDALKMTPKLTVPVLYVVAKSDADFAVDAQKLYDATASSDKGLHVLPAGGHGVDLVRPGAQGRTLVEQFIRAH
jgi:pimeloyl-ACP methyl ester carboxylesterase